MPPVAPTSGILRRLRRPGCWPLIANLWQLPTRPASACRGIGLAPGRDPEEKRDRASCELGRALPLGAVLFEPANADDPDGVRHRHNCRRDTYRARDVRSLVLRRRPPSGRRRAPARRIRKRAIDRELGPDFPELAAHPLELKLQAGKLLVGPGPLSRDHLRPFASA